MSKETSDFRYNTGATKVPWAAVGENYNLQDTMEFVKFLMGGKGKEYNAALKEVGTALARLSKVSTPPGKLSMGDKVAEVERMIDKYLGVEEGSSLFVSNCTAALELGYRYAGIGPGDEVIVPSNTFIATVAYPLSVGAKLVFADVDPVTVNIDPKDIARKITKKTKIIVPVHIGGYPCDMDAIMKLAKKHDIVVMEDAAHGFGGEYKPRWVRKTIMVEPENGATIYDIYKHLYKAIREGVEFPVKFEEAIEVVRVTNAIKRQNPAFAPCPDNE